MTIGIELNIVRNFAGWNRCTRANEYQMLCSRIRNQKCINGCIPKRMVASTNIENVDRSKRQIDEDRNGLHRRRSARAERISDEVIMSDERKQRASNGRRKKVDSLACNGDGLKNITRIQLKASPGESAGVGVGNELEDGLTISESILHGNLRVNERTPL